MIDRFLFRGKYCEGVSWATGGLAYIDRNGAHIQTTPNSAVWCDPATVGQCTGLRDKNGTLIFEGDILEHFTEGRTEVAFDESGAMFSFCRRGDGSVTYFGDFGMDCHEFVIIGNVHDNPELLKGAETK